jgi:threonine/homoserine efflux transporter RhtA
MRTLPLCADMIRWLLLIPFALLIAIGASGTFFLIATIVDPVMAVLTGDTLFVGLWSLVDAVFAADDPGPIVEDAFLAVGRIVFTLLVFPPLMIAIISEVLGMRSLLWHALATGILTAAVPFILRGSARIASPAELHVSVVLGLTGAVAGLVYWAIIGGREPRRPNPTAPLSGS